MRVDDRLPERVPLRLRLTAAERDAVNERARVPVAEARVDGDREGDAVGKADVLARTLRDRDAVRDAVHVRLPVRDAVS